MDVFKYRDTIVSNYRSFSTSFTKIKAEDINAYINDAYDSGVYWPDPLIQLNPSFVAGQTVEQLVASKELNPICKEIFRFGREGGNPGITAQLHKHQEEALDIAQNGESYVLTTGTGFLRHMSQKK